MKDTDTLRNIAARIRFGTSAVEDAKTLRDLADTIDKTRADASWELSSAREGSGRGGYT